MSYSFNIAALFEQVGITPNRGVQQIFDRIVKYKDINTDRFESEHEYTSKLGVPVWDIIFLDEKVIEGTGENFQGYEFPAEMVLEVSRAKKVVEEDVAGKDGMTEELVALGDWEIQMSGVIINYGSLDYPEAEVSELQEICSLRDSLLGVTSKYLNNLGINYISIRDLKLPQLPGYSNVQPFKISAKSRNPFILNPTNGIEL